MTKKRFCSGCYKSYPVPNKIDNGGNHVRQCRICRVVMCEKCLINHKCKDCYAESYVNGV